MSLTQAGALTSPPSNVTQKPPGHIWSSCCVCAFGYRYSMFSNLPSQSLAISETENKIKGHVLFPAVTSLDWMNGRQTLWPLGMVWSQQSISLKHNSRRINSSILVSIPATRRRRTLFEPVVEWTATYPRNPQSNSPVGMIRTKRLRDTRQRPAKIRNKMFRFSPKTVLFSIRFSLRCTMDQLNDKTARNVKLVADHVTPFLFYLISAAVLVCFT